MSRDVSKGDIPSLVLSVLADGPCHGYAIAREVERRSRDFFRLREGSLYPALRVLEAQGWIAGAWEAGGGPSRRVYTLTDEGRREAAKRAGEWRDYASAMRAVLSGSKSNNGSNKGDQNVQPA